MNASSHPLVLAREDLMDMEGMLCGQLSSFLSFSGHALYFPTDDAPDGPRLLPRERRLLLPLPWEGRLLGVLMLHGVRAREARPLLRFLPAVAQLCLGNMARARAMRTDALTGLATEECLFSHMEDAAGRLRDWLEAPGAEDGGPAPLHWLCMGLVLLRLANGPSIVRRGGHLFAETCLRELAEACRTGLPSDVTAARVGRWEFALLFPAGGRGACRKLAEAALARMDAVRMTYPLLKTAVQPRLCAGHALYPQDMLGVELKLDMFDQARRCMDRARLAADVAEQRVRAGQGPGRRVMPFARILQEGGVVLESLPLGRVRLSVGRQAKAREGMRFAVWSDAPAGEGGAPRYRGEVVILRTRDTDSVAEALHLADAARLPEPGDRLALLGETPVLSPDLSPAGEEDDALWPPRDMTVEDVSSLPSPELSAAVEDEEDEAGKGASVLVAPSAASAAAAAADRADGLCGHGDFLNRFAVEAEHCRRFTLALLRLEAGDAGPSAATAPASSALDAVLALWRESPAASAAQGGRAPMVGLYGSNSLIVFHAERTADELAPLYAGLSDASRARSVSIAVGLAGYPFLRYRRGEMPDCALKALEYARLLPEPKVGVCNSLALNISADRRYSLGDVFGAVEEYKLALLADEGNVMARNSLGVCMAALGRNQEARRYFLEALRRKPDKAALEQICYNLGTVCQSLGERRAAARYYRQCIKLAPEHLFAHIRLGQLCEAGGRRAEARRCYERAAAIEDARPGTPSAARRHLARVAARQRRGGEARELLHEALSRNPRDAASMLLLANIYLDSKEDPAMAELLARKSAGLRDRPEAWQTLARALRALNREEEARVAEARAVLS